MDLRFELATQIMSQVGDTVTVVDEVHGFRYFDMCSMVGFVDGTENPVGQEEADFTLIGDEDPQFKGGSYVLVQKYLHDMEGWNQYAVWSAWFWRVWYVLHWLCTQARSYRTNIGKYGDWASTGLFFVPSAELLKELETRIPDV